MADYFIFLSTLSTILIFIFFIIKLKSRTNNDYPPSPWGLPIIGHLHLLMGPLPLHRALAAISSLYGPILLLRFGSRRVLVVSSLSLAEECFTKNDVTFANRPRLLAGKLLGYNYTSLGWASYGPHWRNLRRMAALELFSATRVSEFSIIRSDEVKSMIKNLFVEYRTKAEASGFAKITGTKSVISDLTYSVIMRMVAADSEIANKQEAQEFKETVNETFRVSGATNIGDFVPSVGWMGIGGIEKKLSELRLKRDEFLDRLIDRHQKKKQSGGGGGGGRVTVIDVLLSLREKEPEYYTYDVIKSVIVNLLTSGTDTSAVTIEWALSLLLNNPEALKTAQAELDAELGQGCILAETDLPKLPYLKAIILETLRMYLATPLLGPHESSEDCTVGGYLVPRGTMLLVNAWSIQRDPKIWEDPEKFKPERFMRQEAIAGNQFYPFGLGRRKCPAENLATRLVSLAVGTLIQCFEWERIGMEEIDMTERTGLTMPRANSLEAMYRPRKAMLDVISNI